MKDKKIISLLILLGVVALMGVAFYYASNKLPQQEIMVPPEEIVQETVKGGVYVTTSLNVDSEGSEISIDIYPYDENPVLLSAIGLRGFISGADFTQEEDLAVLSNEFLVENGWQYKITNAAVMDDGKILVEIAANHRGSELYPLEDEISLGVIQLGGEYGSALLKFEADTESTVFAGEDVELLYPYQSK